MDVSAKNKMNIKNKADRKTCPLVFVLLQLDCTGNLAGTKATSANIQTARGAVDNRFYTFNIGFPSSVGTSVGVGNLDAKGDFLTADIAFCHLKAPPFSAREYNSKGYTII